MAAAAIDLAAPMLAAVALFASGLLTPAVALVLVGWVLYYFFALESGGGQTVGKRAMHLKVVSADGREADHGAVRQAHGCAGGRHDRHRPAGDAEERRPAPAAR